MKGKKKSRERPHPAAEAVESDGVRLMKEFEFLKEELKKNDSVVESHNDGIRAAHINLDMAVSFHQKKIAHAQRQRRMLEAQFSNVNELLQNQLPNCGLNRLSATECRHPLFTR